MSDPVAEAAAQLAAAPSSEPVQAPEVAQAGEQSAVTVSSPEMSSATSAPTSPSVSTGNSASADAPVTGNVLVNETPVVAAPEVAPVGEPVTAEAVIVPSAAPSSTQPTSPVAGSTSELPRESHLMLLEAKIAGFRAKLANAERVALDEFEAIVGHVRAVL